jgi:hypothetical protein
VKTCDADVADVIDEGPVRWWCTLDEGHQGDHEGHGAVPLPVWGDDGVVRYVPVDDEDDL